MAHIYSKLRNLLFNADLSEAQILIYIELLKKPAKTIWELIQRTGLRKTTIYNAYFELKKLQMVEKNNSEIRALSLKALVAELRRTERKKGKVAFKLKQISPFLHMPRESVEEFETFYTPEQIAEVYLFMSKLKYDVNLDFGDYENFIGVIGGNELGLKFRFNRSKHATHHAICTTFGPNLAEFCKKEDLQKFKNRFDVYEGFSFRNRWIIFSDKSDYVLFNDVSDPEYPCSTLVKSKIIADTQRLNFDNFSKIRRNN